MKFIIKHEIKGRIRISLARKFHTVREADVLEQYLLGLDGVTAFGGWGHRLSGERSLPIESLPPSQRQCIHTGRAKVQGGNPGAVRARQRPR